MEPICAEVNLGAIRRNFQALTAILSPQTGIMAVVKADAYGHGAVLWPGNCFSRQPAACCGQVLEGEELRAAGITAPVLVLGLIEPRQAAKAISLDLSLAVASKDLAQALSSAAVEQGKTCPVHVKVDTGMGRIGIRPSQARDFIRWLQELPGIKVEGLSHFATADSHDKTVARQQLAQFTALKKDLEGLEIPNFHLANSAGILNFPQAHFSLVRPGIALYGLPPSQEREPRVKLEPALTWKARLNFIKELPPGVWDQLRTHFHTTGKLWWAQCLWVMQTATAAFCPTAGRCWLAAGGVPV